MSEFPTVLRTLVTDLNEAEWVKLSRGGLPEKVEKEKTAVVQRSDETTVGLRSLYEVFTAGMQREWESKQASDGWLAPRLHWALRLTRREAADPGCWRWLAGRLSRTYVEWRWADNEGVVATNRYVGGIHKQAFARLWWGAELFRDGDDYRPVERMFRNQDYPNSYIHRAFSRNRPLSLAVLRELERRTGAQPTSDQINDVARKVNLWMAPLSIEAVSGHWEPDTAAYNKWVREEPPQPLGEALPAGPPDGRVPDGILVKAIAVAAEICDQAAVGV